MNHWVLMQFEANNSEYLNKLINNEAVDVRQFPDEVISQLKVLTKEVIEELIEKDSFAKRVYENYVAFKTKQALWANSSERIYYNALN
jgi:TRAP-type mannitol/chloroaromatic compound transport system substrate-binding protein